ncbi:IS3 family transposase, partial [Gordonia sp. Z-3]|uniref:IS3 family transposase n=1 Tax=Gordonia sp. Z-3 TaxID=3115408 RepID=UPI002E2DBD2C
AANRIDNEPSGRSLPQARPLLASQCGDNAAMESFFALLQRNVLDRQRWDTREQLRIAIVTWIERTYRRRRRQARLGRLTPVEFEAMINTAAAAA